MPIQDGKYVAPNWNNSSPPPYQCFGTKRPITNG